MIIVQFAAMGNLGIYTRNLLSDTHAHIEMHILKFICFPLLLLLAPLAGNTELVIEKRVDQCRAWVRDTTKNRPLERNLYLRDTCTDPLPGTPTPTTPKQVNKQVAKPITIAKRQCLKFMHFTFDLRDCADLNAEEDTDWKEFHPFASETLASIPKTKFGETAPIKNVRTIFGHEAANIYHKKIAQAYIDNEINRQQVCSSCQAYAFYNQLLTHHPGFVRRMPPTEEPINEEFQLDLYRPEHISINPFALRESILGNSITNNHKSAFAHHLSPKHLYLFAGMTGDEPETTEFYIKTATNLTSNSVKRSSNTGDAAVIEIARLVELGIFPSVRVSSHYFIDSFRKLLPRDLNLSRWNNFRYTYLGILNKTEYHSIQVIGVIRGDDSGIKGFYINDSGSGWVSVLERHELARAVELPISIHLGRIKEQFFSKEISIPTIWYIDKPNLLGAANVISSHKKIGNDELALEIQCNADRQCNTIISTKVDAGLFAYSNSLTTSAIDFWKDTYATLSIPSFKTENGCTFASSSVKLSLIKGIEEQDIIVVNPAHGYRYRKVNGRCQTQTISNSTDKNYYLTLSTYFLSNSNDFVNNLDYYPNYYPIQDDHKVHGVSLGVNQPLSTLELSCEKKLVDLYTGTTFK